MKKILALLMALLMFFTFTACEQKDVEQALDAGIIAILNRTGA